MWVAGVLWLAMALPAAAQAAELSLPECITIALQQQSDVLQGEYALKGSAAKVTQAKSSYYPQITVDASQPVIQEGMPQVSTDGSISLGLSQNLYDGGLRELKIHRAQDDLAQNTASLERTRQTVTFNVTKSYYSLLRAQRLADVSNTQVQYIQGQLQMAEARVAAGDAAEVELLPIQAELANAQVDALAAKNSARTATIQLQQAMGLPLQGDFAIQEATVAEDQAILTLDESLAQAKARRPEVRESKASLDSAGTAVKTAKLDLSPRPVVTGQMGQDLTGDNGNTISLSAGIAYSLFSGGNTRAVYDEAIASRDSARVRAAQVDKDIVAEVEQAYLNLTDAQERRNASDVSLQAARRNLDAQEERYRQGLAIPLDLLNAQLQLTTANNNAVQARYDYYTALAQLDYATGK